MFPINVPRNIPSNSIILYIKLVFEDNVKLLQYTFRHIYAHNVRTNIPKRMDMNENSFYLSNFERMTSFLLPRLSVHLYQKIDIKDQENDRYDGGSYSLAYYLTDIKTTIEYHQCDWDFYKRLTNPYEYIDTIIPNKLFRVAKLKPLSRSYYKMIEILHMFDLGILRIPGSSTEIRPVTIHDPTTKHVTRALPGIQSFHLAEGPGGFIEALSSLRQNNPKDVYYGMTLIGKEGSADAPGWKKSKYFLQTHSNVILEKGIDGTGDLLSFDNFKDMTLKYGGQMDFITADGGFDFSFDFNHQEKNAATLIFAQIAYAICLQKQHGCFVLKVFDIFSLHFYQVFINTCI